MRKSPAIRTYRGAPPGYRGYYGRAGLAPGPKRYRLTTKPRGAPARRIGRTRAVSTFERSVIMKSWIAPRQPVPAAAMAVQCRQTMCSVWRWRCSVNWAAAETSAPIRNSSLRPAIRPAFWTPCVCRQSDQDRGAGGRAGHGDGGHRCQRSRQTRRFPF